MQFFVFSWSAFSKNLKISVQKSLNIWSKKRKIIYLRSLKIFLAHILYEHSLVSLGTIERESALFACWNFHTTLSQVSKSAFFFA